MDADPARPSFDTPASGGLLWMRKEKTLIPSSRASGVSRDAATGAMTLMKHAG